VHQTGRFGVGFSERLPERLGRSAEVAPNVSNELSNYRGANRQRRLDDPGSFRAPSIGIDAHLGCFTPKKVTTSPQVGGSGAVRRVSPDNPVVSDLPRHHLHAWRFLLEAGVMPTYAHMSLIGTAHESAKQPRTGRRRTQPHVVGIGEDEVPTPWTSLESPRRPIRKSPR
jgi:hypothetical protein